MNKKELAAEAARRAGIERDEADAAVTAVFDIIAERLAAGEEVRLSGFGTFGVKERPARGGRNPATGEPIPIPAARVPKFRPGKSLKDALNRKGEDTDTLG